jgi:hypothetical protein
MEAKGRRGREVGNDDLRLGFGRMLELAAGCTEVDARGDDTTGAEDLCTADRWRVAGDMVVVVVPSASENGEHHVKRLQATTYSFFFF